MAIYYSPSKKSFVDDKLAYKSLPKDLIAVDPVTHKNLIKEINSNKKDIAIINGSITLVDKQSKQVEMSWETVRSKRKKLLNESDYTQLHDYPNKDKSEWAKYRQTLLGPSFQCQLHIS